MYKQNEMGIFIMKKHFNVSNIKSIFFTDEFNAFNNANINDVFVVAINNVTALSYDNITEMFQIQSSDYDQTIITNNVSILKHDFNKNDDFDNVSPYLEPLTSISSFFTPVNDNAPERDHINHDEIKSIETSMQSINDIYNDIEFDDNINFNIQSIRITDNNDNTYELVTDVNDLILE